MLRITHVAFEVVEMLQPMLETIRRKNRNVAKQLDEASTSTAANICEGNGHRDAARRHKYEIALGEAHETAGWIRMAEDMRLAKRPSGIDAKLSHVIAVLTKLTRRP